MAQNTAQVDNLVSLLDGYATKGGHHLNVIIRPRLVIRLNRRLRERHGYFYEKNVKNLNCDIGQFISRYGG